MTAKRKQPGGPPAAGKPFIPPTAHESMQRLLPAMKELLPAVAHWVRERSDWDERRTMSPVESQACLQLVDFVEDYTRQAHIVDGLSVEDAITDGDFLGMHLYYYANLELHRRKIFWVDESLAWMLARTRLDIEGEVLRLPFPCCAFIFTDPETLGVCSELQRKHTTGPSEPPKILTVYVLGDAPADGEARGVRFAFLIDDVGASWPYLVTRDLYIRPKDNLEAMLESHFPDVDAAGLDPLFSASELKRLLHLVINAVLYATTADLLPRILHSPLAARKSAVAGRGKVKQRKQLRRLERETATVSGEDVFYLPGKIEISRLRELSELERTPTGRTLMKRFMVRGHWRKANPSWLDQRLRWVEPYWKGPELATIIEREYRMKP